MKKRKGDSHKGENGKVLVVGGSEKYSGAVYLAASAVAALRCGTDIVEVMAPEKVAWAINSLTPDLITIKLSGKNIGESHKKKILHEVEGFDVVLLGNGVGGARETQRTIRYLVEKIAKKKVVDGDALRFIDLRKISEAVLTPHGDEFKELLKNSKLEEKNFQKTLVDNVLLLKGRVDKIYTKNGVRKNRTGNEGMTVGGTGDVLAGLVAGFISQDYSLEEAAYLGAKLNGKIGDGLAKKLGYGFVASDFLKEIAIEVKKLKPN